jgi:hypothetical protein
MSERHFRLILGIWLIISQFFNNQPLMYALLVVLLMEGATGWRVPLVVWHIRHGRQEAFPDNQFENAESAFPFEAERALRLIVAGLLALSVLAFPGYLWWLPWFVGFALAGAGLSGLCPMVQGLRWLGLR